MTTDTPLIRKHGPGVTRFHTIVHTPDGRSAFGPIVAQDGNYFVVKQGHGPKAELRAFDWTQPGIEIDIDLP